VNKVADTRKRYHDAIVANWQRPKCHHKPVTLTDRRFSSRDDLVAHDDVACHRRWGRSPVAGWRRMERPAHDLERALELLDGLDVRSDQEPIARALDTCWVGAARNREVIVGADAEGIREIAEDG